MSFSLPLSYTHRDAYARDIARKCSSVNFGFQKYYFCIVFAKASESRTKESCQTPVAHYYLGENRDRMREGSRTPSDRTLNSCSPVAQ
jgi:hypothetical protein